MISPELMDVLACPTCKSDLTLKKNELYCKKCKVSYEIKEDVPVLFPKN